MKRIAIIAMSVALVAVLVFGVMPAMADKPTENGSGKNVVEWSNGFPSGPHFNLNIHGSKACPSDEGGGSIFVPEYGDGLIQYVMNKKSSWTGLYVKDKCSTGPNDPAIVLLPKGYYQVYVRIQGKPGKPKFDETRSVAFYPRLIEACNDAAETIDGFGEFFDCSDESLIGLGVVTGAGAFKKTEHGLERIVPVRKNNKAEEITDMFRWSGYIVPNQYDVYPVGDPDGFITVDDLIILQGDPWFLDVDYDGNGLLEGSDVEAFCAEYGTPTGEIWIFDLADLVVYGWDYQNNGAKLVQVRFYPVDETVFVQ